MEDLSNTYKFPDTIPPNPSEEEIEQIANEMASAITQQASEEIDEDVFDAEGKPTVAFTEAFLRLFAKEMGIEEKVIREEIAAELGVPPDEVIGAMIQKNYTETQAVVDPASGPNQLDLFVTRDEDVKEAVDITDEFPIPERTLDPESGTSTEDIPPVL